MQKTDQYYVSNGSMQVFLALYVLTPLFIQFKCIEAVVTRYIEMLFVFTVFNCTLQLRETTTLMNVVFCSVISLNIAQRSYSL